MEGGGPTAFLLWGRGDRLDLHPLGRDQVWQPWCGARQRLFPKQLK